MKALDGKHEVQLSLAQFSELAGRYHAVDLDVGTGDGGFVLDRARAFPNRFVVGLDPVAGAMSQAANRITRRRTRQKNALFIVASVEQMPVELDGQFDSVFVNLPWGSLMRGLILGEREILDPLAAIGRPGTTYRFILNLRVFANPVPREIQDLPELTPTYVDEHLASKYQAAGLEITSRELLDQRRLEELRSTWARRLSHERPPPSIEILARRILVATARS